MNADEHRFIIRVIGVIRGFIRNGDSDLWMQTIFLDFNGRAETLIRTKPVNIEPSFHEASSGM
jgi:hypothetical protein